MTDSSLLDTVAPLDRFRAMVMADPALQLRLSALRADEAFATAAVDIAGSAGIALDPGMLYAAMRPDPLGIGRFSGAAITNRAAPGEHWLPSAVVPSAGELAVDWVHFAGRPLADPFFSDELYRARAQPLNRLLHPRTPLGALNEAMGENPRPPAGFVFHLSRCGSTLVSQMLATDPRNIVVSEAEPIDAIVQLAAGRVDVPVEVGIDLLRAMVATLGRDRLGGGGHYVVKLDSWHILALPLFRAAFPDTPWVFLYRDPVEILVSHDRMAGAQTVPGALLFDPYGIENASEMDPDHFTGRALGKTAAAAVEHFGLGGGLLVNYTALPEAVEARILPHFGITLDEDGRAALARASRQNAKAPSTSFTSDSDSKRQAASAKIREIAAAYMDEPHRQLEALRLADEK